jgi:phosphohistidine phosphatase SixA
MRSLLSLLALLFLAGEAGAQEALLRALAAGGHVAIMRHALAPGTGDPPNFRLGDCGTQRNLGDGGRADARTIGRRLKQAGVKPARVLSSPWCRCLETARLLDLGPVQQSDALAQLATDGKNGGQIVAAMRQLIAGLDRSGPSTIMVTHQTNITALTDVDTVSGEIVVLKLEPGGSFSVAGKIPPP